jgi:hypothetical protein
MTEIVIRNKELLKTLDETIDMFLPHRELMEELSNQTYMNPEERVPVGEGEIYCKPESLQKMLDKGMEHKGFPEQGYGFQVAYGRDQRPDVFAPLKHWTKTELPMRFGARSNSLTSYYPPGGFVGWHTNWNAHGYQIILTWSEDGDGYFTYYDKEKDEFIKHPDKKGWQARWYRFGREDEPEHHCWHAAWTNCPRFTLAFKFPYHVNGMVMEDQAFDAIQDFITELETP